MSDGSCLGIEQDYHPDDLVEAIRWQRHEARVLQAIGRARGVNRTGEKPLQVDILDNVCLPVLLDEVVGFEPPLPIIDMLAEGVVLTSPQDIAAAWPEVFESEPTAKRFTSDYGDELELEAVGKAAGEPGWQAFTYQWAGAGQRPRAGCYLRAVVGAIEPWLAGRVAGSAASWRRSRLAAPQRLAAMLNAARIAARPASPTTAVATGTVQNARVWHARSGWPIGRPTCCRFRIFMSSSPCRRSSPPSRCRTRRSSTTSCSRPRPRRCASSPPIQNTSALRPA